MYIRRAIRNGAIYWQWHVSHEDTMMSGMPYVKKDRVERTCTVCGATFAALLDRARFCSERCRLSESVERRRATRTDTCTLAGCANTAFSKGLCTAHYQKQRTYGDPLARHPRFIAWEDARRRTCKHCELAFALKTALPDGKGLYCSRVCAATAKRVHTTSADQRRAHSHVRSARVKATSDGSVTSKKAIFERDRYICYLCNEPTRPDMSHRHPLSPRLEHAVSLAQGGTHTEDNVFCAHNGCNTRKGTKPWYDILLA